MCKKVLVDFVFLLYGGVFYKKGEAREKVARKDEGSADTAYYGPRGSAILKDILVSTRGKQPNAAREEGKEGRRWEEES